jgi:predicted LPLAT superfamily acyltransferase
MKVFIYRILSGAARLFGFWFFSFFTWIITGGFYFLFPGRRRASLDFYRALFPGRGRWFSWRLAWRQYHHFSTVFVDRLRLESPGEINIVTEGREEIRHGNGILLMSHVGNWEVAARAFRGFGMKLLIFIGERQDEAIEKEVKSDLAGAGITTVVASENEDQVFNSFESIRCLKEGGFIAIAGDRLWLPGQKTLSASFLGREVELPRAPFGFALALKVPIYPFFTIKEKNEFRVIIHPPIYVEAAARGEREAAMRGAAERYLALLEATLRAHPDHWYRFEPFWKK